jgi:hypothetical protein
MVLMTARLPGTIAWPVGALPPDAVTVDALARLQLSALRCGREIRLHDVSSQLRELIEFCGLREVLGVEVRRQAEQREEPVRVEEERQLDDPAS